MRNFGSNSTMQTLELMWLNDQIRDMREGRPPRRGPPNDIGPGCLLKFMALAAFLVLMVYSLGHDRTGGKAMEQPSPKPPPVEAPTPSPANPDRKIEPIRLWTDTSGKYQVEATLVDFNDNMVCLQEADGGNVKVAMNWLSSNDRQYVYRFRKQVSIP
jgi:hypothetical protein